MHMDDLLRSSQLVEIVNVLRAQKQAATALCETSLQAGERLMRGVRCGRQEVLAAHVLKGMHFIWAVRKRFGCSQLHWIEAGPKAIPIAKGAKAALG